MNKKAIERMLHLIEKYKQNRADILGDEIIKEDIRRRFLINILKNEHIDIDIVLEFRELFLIEKELTLLYVEDAFKIAEFGNYNRTVLTQCLYGNISINTIRNCYNLLGEEDKAKLIKMHKLDADIVRYILETENNEDIKKILKVYQSIEEDG